MGRDETLSFELCGERVVPSFLGPPDAPWLRKLIDLFTACTGEPRRLLAERLREAQPPPGPVRRRWLLAAGVLERCYLARTRSELPPPRARELLFARAAAAPAGSDGRIDRGAVIAQAAAALGVPPGALREALFADLPGEQRLQPRDPDAGDLGPEELALRANLALVQSLLTRATDVTLCLMGGCRGLVQHARWRGLILTVTPAAPGLAGTGATAGWADAVLHLSGPFALFRRTLLYGRALAELVTHLGRPDRYLLRARCRLRQGTYLLELSTGAPIYTAPAPRRFDSALERRFARELARRAPGWEVVREPEPVRAGDTFVFPDFALRQREAPHRAWLLEIVGFWTPGYLARKLELLGRAGLDRLILCIDAELACGQATELALPRGARAVFFRRTLDVDAVLAVIHAEAAAPRADILVATRPGPPPPRSTPSPKPDRSAPPRVE